MVHYRLCLHRGDLKTYGIFLLLCTRMFKKEKILKKLISIRSHGNVTSFDTNIGTLLPMFLPAIGEICRIIAAEAKKFGKMHVPRACVKSRARSPPMHALAKFDNRLFVNSLTISRNQRRSRHRRRLC